MAEIVASALMLLGAAIALVAAIGVARLPDAFLRMHAATKAGVVGSGLVLLGVGVAFGGEAWFRVGLIVLFLLITVPISSHALGRAAYVGGAPMWSGTGLDELEGVLPRHAIDADPSQRLSGRPALRLAEADFVPRGGPRRILVALAHGEGAEASLRAALGALAHPEAEITLQSLLCAPSLARTGPVPLGGAHFARRLTEARLHAAREAAAALTERLETACEEGGLSFRTRHDEGEAAALLTRAAAHHDLTVMPRDTWFDQAQVLPEGEAALMAARMAFPGLLLVAPDFRRPRGINFLHAEDAASAEALKRLLALDLLEGRSFFISMLDHPGADEALAESLALAAARGQWAEPAHTRLDPEVAAPEADFSGDILAAIPARPARPGVAWASLRDAPHSVLLV